MGKDESLYKVASNIFGSTGFWVVYSGLATTSAFIEFGTYTGVVGLLFFIPIICFILMKAFENASFNQVSGRLFLKDIVFNWSILEGGDFVGRYGYVLVNNTAGHVSYVPELSMGGQADAVEVEFEYSSNSDAREIISIRDISAKMTGSHATLAGEKARILSFNAIIVPPLPPKEEMSFEVVLRVKGWDKSAFTAQGEVMGVAAPVFITNATVRLAGPTGYQFQLMGDPVIVSIDQKERVRRSVFERIGQPDVQGNLIEWKLQNLLPGRRYWVRHRLEKSKLGRVSVEHGPT